MIPYLPTIMVSKLRKLIKNDKDELDVPRFQELRNAVFLKAKFCWFKYRTNKINGNSRQRM